MKDNEGCTSQPQGGRLGLPRRVGGQSTARVGTCTCWKAHSPVRPPCLWVHQTEEAEAGPLACFDAPLSSLSLPAEAPLSGHCAGLVESRTGGGELAWGGDGAGGLLCPRPGQQGQPLPPRPHGGASVQLRRQAASSLTGTLGEPWGWQEEGGRGCWRKNNLEVQVGFSDGGSRMQTTWL